ncbi:MAG: solute carrier family 12 sodium/potassium/chloride transporter 2 [Cellvibrionaceae bacterium]|jgi:solute carrier family 12 sodium/potassium/chloride transporter 2
MKLLNLFGYTKITSDQKGFNTFEGVFLPTLLTILGAVMYLRTGWVVGNAGILGGFLIITISNVITLCTGLSISAIATNIRVGAGGSFSIISQSLGLEVGGSVNLPFYIAQAISVAFYIFAFAEGWQTIFPSHSLIIVLFAAYAVCFLVAFTSVELAAQIRYPILLIVAFSLFSAFLGATAYFRSSPLITPQAWGDFSGGSFWQVFAVFFPAVTGVLAGVNLSGTLRSPRQSIPMGTIGAIIVSYVVYMILAYWTSVVATPQELVGNFAVMVDKAAFGWAIQAGILAATFSAALNSLVGAPRILQAMAAHRVVPFGPLLAQETETGEPRNALYVTGLIGIGTIVFGLSGGGLNSIAPLMTMFFLITYAVLNGVMVLEQSLKLTSFRPHLRIPRFVPIVGLFGSIIAMLLINPIFSLVAFVVIIAIYEFLSLRQLTTPWSDVRSGMFVSMAEWAARRVLSLPTGQDRAWKPSLLVPVQSIAALRYSYRFLEAITIPNGTLHILGCYQEGEREKMEALLPFQDAFARDGVFARIALVEARRFRYTLQTAMEVFTSAFFRPNILFFPIQSDIAKDKVAFILSHAAENEMGAILYFDNPNTALGREQVINVWIREQSPEWEVGLRLSNLDLALLLAYQLARNWEGQINLLTIVKSEEDQEPGELFLRQLIDFGRMPNNTKTFVHCGNMADFLSTAPQADLNIFGLLADVDISKMVRLSEQTDSSCIFVRDSGYESAMA